MVGMLLLLIIAGSVQGLASEYLLGVGDVLRISVWGHGELTTEVSVRPDGYITFPLVGDHWAVDKTPRQLSSEIQAILGEFVVNPQVTVIVSQFRTLQVQVLGEVTASGYYQLKAGSRLTDVLALAQGPTETADLSRVTVTRYEFDAEGQEQTRVRQADVHQFLETGDLLHNPLIESDDLIFVPASGRATVFGEVGQPGSYDLGSGLDVLDLLALAGGVLDSADLENVVITRQIKEEPVEQIINVKSYMEGKNKPIPVEPNDVVFIPKQQQVTVFGAVASPGIYTLHSESRLIDILARAGGVLRTGDATQVAITRRAGSEQDLILANVEPGLKGQIGGDNPLLSADDVIYVPDGYQNVLVFGQVRSPGAYAVTEQTRLLDLLARVGGVTDRADDELTLTRDGEVMHVDIGALQRLGLQNEKVLPGDILYVPEGNRRVLILGEVRSPGFYQLRAGDRVLDAIGLAGGLTANALEDQVSVSRQSPDGLDITVVDFSDLMDNRYLAENLLLQGGDVIIVPRAERGVFVLGEVQRPGYYQFKAGDGLLDAIMLAGGFSASAAEEQVSLTRQMPDGPVIETIDFSRLMEERYLAKDKLLKGGDIIVVPRSDRSVLVLGEIRQPGYYVFTKGQSIMDLIGRAGGFTANAEPAKVVVTRDTEEGVVTETLNLDLRTGTDYSRLLQGGEIITVPTANRMILVFGSVARAGAYTLPQDGRLLDILAMAGGLQTNLGNEQVVVTRQSGTEEQIWQLSYSSLMEEQSEHNLPLIGGDVIYVPTSKRQILVLGMVKNPGVYSLPAGARVMDALAMAGGPLDRAALESVGIYRDGSLEDSDIVSMGHNKQLFTGDASENPLLNAGDIIYVPETNKPDWTKIFGFVGAISSFKDAILNIFGL